jgi:hypothetical protein
MSLDKNINTLEKAKFLETDEGKTSVRVSLSGGLAPESYDEVQVTYPTDSTEVYTFKLNTITKSVVTVTYIDSTKENLVSAVRS